MSNNNAGELGLNYSTKVAQSQLTRRSGLSPACFVASTLLAVFQGSFALAQNASADSFQTVTIQASGVGETVEQAKRELVLDAIRQVTTTFAMRKETIRNDEVDTKIATFNEGVVRSVDLTGTPEKIDHGSFHIWRVTGTVSVARKNLIDSLTAAKIELNGPMRSETLLARAISLNQLQAESADILNLLLEDDPRRYRANLTGVKPVSVYELSSEEAAVSLSWLVATVKIASDHTLYRDEIGPRLMTVMNAITEKQMRASQPFEKMRQIDGFAWPNIAPSDNLQTLVEDRFKNISFAGATIGWQPRSELSHLYRELFFPKRTIFAFAVERTPAFNSKATWEVGSCRAPDIAYNVHMVLPDALNQFHLKKFYVAPAFFGPFAQILSKTASNKSTSTRRLLLTVRLVDGQDQNIATYHHPLPQENWVSPYVWAGSKQSNTDLKSLFIMPAGLAPRVCGTIGIEQMRSISGIQQTRFIINTFSTISSSTVQVKFPVKETQLKTMSRIRVTIDP